MLRVLCVLCGRVGVGVWASMCAYVRECAWVGGCACARKRDVLVFLFLLHELQVHETLLISVFTVGRCRGCYYVIKATRQQGNATPRKKKPRKKLQQPVVLCLSAPSCTLLEAHCLD